MSVRKEEVKGELEEKRSIETCSIVRCSDCLTVDDNDDAENKQQADDEQPNKTTTAVNEEIRKERECTR